MKKRADVILFEQGLAKSRENAKALIMEGVVFCGTVRIDKPGDMIKEESVLTVKGNPVPFVSRGGLKLKKAIDIFDITVENKTAADLGASTGGFTDVMLKHGAKHVYAIDVGYGQLDWTLRNDERVTVMERTNARNMQAQWFDSPIEFATMDLSFISVKLILAPLYPIMVQGGEAVVLVKPQFEAGKEKVGKKGVVRSKDVHVEVFCDVATFCYELGFNIVGLDFSPITGPEGNIEFLLALRKEKQNVALDEVYSKITEVVEKAHSAHTK